MRGARTNNGLDRIGRGGFPRHRVEQSAEKSDDGCKEHPQRREKYEQKEKAHVVAYFVRSRVRWLSSLRLSQHVFTVASAGDPGMSTRIKSQISL